MDEKVEVEVYVVGEPKGKPSFAIISTIYFILFVVIPMVVSLNVVEIGLSIRGLLTWLS